MTKEDVKQIVLETMSRGTPRSTCSELPMTTRTAAVIGGMTEASGLQEASDWVKESSEKVGLKRPDDALIKGGAFEGMFFARSPDGASVSQAVERFRGQRMKYKGKPIWSGQDRPLAA
eukprot:4048321-Pyramimonas_sp.AAC.1